MDLTSLTDVELKSLYIQTKNKISINGSAQLAKKVQLNSAYGALANRWFRYYDLRLASAITISGQLSLRWVEQWVNKFLNSYNKTKNYDYIVAADTDSIYICLDKLIKSGMIKQGKTIRETKEFVDEFCSTVIQKQIKDAFSALSKRMNAFENSMHMKRESIANKAIWQAKKRYIANVLNSEGVEHDPPKIKMMGIETVRSSTPAASKQALKEAIKLILETDEETVQKYIKQFRLKFSTLTFEEIAFPRGINGMDKYHDAVTLYKSGCPIHVKAALVYNSLLDKHGLTQYPKIYNKDKIKFCYVRLPNPFMSPVIAAPRSPPIELEVEKYIDWDLQFNKAFLEPLKAILEIVNWSAEKQNTIEGLFE